MREIASKIIKVLRFDISACCFTSRCLPYDKEISTQVHHSYLTSSQSNAQLYSSNYFCDHFKFLFLVSDDNNIDPVHIMTVD